MQQHLAAVFALHEEDQRRLAEKQDIIDKQDAEIGRLRAEVVRLKKMVRQHAQSLIEEAQTGGVPAVTQDVLAQLITPAAPVGTGVKERNPLADSFVL